MATGSGKFGHFKVCGSLFDKVNFDVNGSLALFSFDPRSSRRLTEEQKFALAANRMRHEWFRTSAAVGFVGYGISATIVSFFVFAYSDFWLLLSGDARRVLSIQEVWYLILASVSAVFCGFTFFIWRPVFPRIIIALVSASMASQVIQFIVAFPAQFLRPIAFCRICVSIATIGFLGYYKVSANNRD